MEYISFRNSKYTVSNNGKILCKRSFRSTPKHRKPFIDRDGYEVLNLTINGVKKHFSIHRIVAEIYVDNPNNLPIVNHIDGNKLNNNFLNLEWSTILKNSGHAAKLGLYANQDGEKNPSAKLKTKQVIEIRQLFNAGLSHSDLADKYGIHRVTVLNIVKRQTWTHI